MNEVIDEILSDVENDEKGTSTHAILDRLTKSKNEHNARALWHLCSHLKAKGRPTKKLEVETASWHYNPPEIRGSTFAGAKGYLYEPWCPEIATNFIVDYLSSRNHKRLLLPWALEPIAVSTLLNKLPSIEEAQALAPTAEFHVQVRLFEYFTDSLLHWIKRPKWTIGKKQNDPRNFEFLNGIPSRFLKSRAVCDLIVYVRPVGTSILGDLQFAAMNLKLTTGGVIFGVVPRNFFGSPHEYNVYDEFNKYGLKIEAVLSIPPSDRTESTKVEMSLVIARPGKQQEMFVGELQNDSRRARLLMKNLESRTSSKDVSLGAVVNKENYRSFSALKERRHYETLVGRQGVKQIKLSELLEGIHEVHKGKGPDFSRHPNAVYLPRQGTSKAYTSAENLPIRSYNYLQLLIDPIQAKADYIAKFFNSELGLRARSTIATGNFVSSITKSAVLSSIFIPLPPLAVQIRVLDADTRLQDLETDIQGVRQKLWDRPVEIDSAVIATNRINRDDSFENWLKTLPFPLASILWNYHASVHEPKAQLDSLLKFFEALAEFYSTILLSASMRDSELWIIVQTYLRKNRSSIERSSFGTWVELTNFISKALRELWNDKAPSDQPDRESGRNRCITALGTQRADVVQALISKELQDGLKTANEFRNDYVGHYGILGEETARDLLGRLERYLSDVRRSFGQMWENYQLVLPTDRSSWTGTHHEVVVNLLQGLNTPFVREKRILREPLKRETLYFLDKDEDHAVEMLPLIKISNAPKDAANACYFYNREQPGGARYVSYHFEKEADKTYTGAEMVNLFQDLFGKE